MSKNTRGEPMSIAEVDAQIHQWIVSGEFRRWRQRTRVATARGGTLYPEHRRRGEWGAVMRRQKKCQDCERMVKDTRSLRCKKCDAKIRRKKRAAAVGSCAPAPGSGIIGA